MQLRKQQKSGEVKHQEISTLSWKISHQISLPLKYILGSTTVNRQY